MKQNFYLYRPVTTTQLMIVVVAVVVVVQTANVSDYFYCSYETRKRRRTRHYTPFKPSLVVVVVVVYDGASSQITWNYSHFMSVGEDRSWPQKLASDDCVSCWIVQLISARWRHSEQMMLIAGVTYCNDWWVKRQSATESIRPPTTVQRTVD